MDKEDQKIMWFVRFSDNTIASCYGTREKAEQMAEKMKDLYGGSYIIV